jgi:catechol 2,3-dioxygenase-like lactoylglutathione lyase family enzyme
VVFRSATCGFAAGRMATASDAGERRWGDSFLNADRSSPPYGHADRGHRCTLPAMPVTTGFNHVATLTTDMDLTVHFYEQAFEAVVTFEVPKGDGHPWMKILDLGGGAALNVFEVPAEEIIGDRRRQGGRGAIDHYALAVESRVTLETVKERLVAAGAQEVGEIQRLGDEWSLFFRDPDGMELEVCCNADG